jgi:heterodisulfide reductase subunit A
MCSARISYNLIKRAFEKGAAAVLVSGCRLGDCHYQNANYNTVRRFKIWQRLVKKDFNLEDDRLMLQLMSAAEAPLFAETMKKLDAIVQKYKDVLAGRKGIELKKMEGVKQ